MNQRHCHECNEALKGRKDQKFCSDYCRNTFNNRLNEDSNATVRKVNRILRKNRRILEELLTKKQCVKPITELIELGYNFPRNEYVLTCGGRTPQFATGAYIRNHIDSVMTEYKGFFPTGFDGHQDPHETTRLRELGVKRYQKAGES